MPAENNELILLPAVRARYDTEGRLTLTHKYLSGSHLYATHWPGPVTSLVSLTDRISYDMDQVPVTEDPLHRIELRPESRSALASRLQGAGLVFSFLSREEAFLSPLCRQLDLPLVYTSEYTPRTEMQIIDATVRNPLRRARSKLWTMRTEHKRRVSLRGAAGLQCSGTPAYEHYRRFHDNLLLFFDNRVPQSQVITEQQLSQRLSQLRPGGKLRLVFGGRLIAMKGVLDLPAFAGALAQLGVDFQLDIYGQGDLEGELKRRIADAGLQDRVALRGILEFAAGWIPRLQQEADLFICCHPQGDPSSTYPEVMSCGVPIVGYANEAFEGIVSRSGSGWLVPMGDVQGLAQQVAALAMHTDEVARHAHLARLFAAAHAFEPTFARRAEHLLQSQARHLARAVT